MTKQQETELEKQSQKIAEAFKNPDDFDKYRKVAEDLKSGKIDEKEAQERFKRYEQEIKETRAIINKTKKLLRQIKKDEKNK